jgi:hypothetical protein
MVITPRKRLIIVAIFVLIIAVIAYALYALFFASGPSVPPAAPTTVEQPGTGTLPVTPEKPLPPTTEQPTGTPTPERPPVGSAQAPAVQTQTLLNANTEGVRLNRDGNTMNFYNSQDKKFYRISQNGQLQELSTKTFANVQNITWAPADDKAILEFPDSSNILFNFATQEQVTLPAHWKDFSFNETGTEIVSKSIAKNEKNRVLIIANADGSNARAVAALGSVEDRVIPSWSPNHGTIAISQTGFPVAGGSGEQQNIYLVSDKTTTLYPQITVDGWDFRSQWSPSGNQLMYSVYNTENNLNPHLWLVTTQIGREGELKTDLGVNTWANKCTFQNEQTVYCAVPQYLEQGYGLAPDLAKTIPDIIYKIDTGTGTKTVVASPEEDYSISSLMVSPDEKELFFTDAAAGGLHKIDLP